MKSKKILWVTVFMVIICFVEIMTNQPKPITISPSPQGQVPASTVERSRKLHEKRDNVHAANDSLVERREKWRR